MSGIQTRKKKPVDLDEEERMKQLLRKPVDAATLNNDKLRPWTVNLSKEKVLKSEINKLGKTMIITSPSTSAGDIGFSVLDQRIPEMEEFSQSLKTRAKLNPYKTIYDNYLLTLNTTLNQKSKGFNHGVKRGIYYQNGNKHPSELPNIRNSDSRTVNSDSRNGSNPSSSNLKKDNIVYPGEGSNSFSGENDRVITPVAGADKADPESREEQASEVDTEYIGRVQRRLLLRSTMQQQRLDLPLPTVEYKPFRNPAIFPVSTTEFERLKGEMRSFPKPKSHLGHRNQLLMMSMVKKQTQLENKAEALDLKRINPTKSVPDIKSSYYHFPRPQSP